MPKNPEDPSTEGDADSPIQPGIGAAAAAAMGLPDGLGETLSRAVFEDPLPGLRKLFEMEQTAQAANSNLLGLMPELEELKDVPDEVPQRYLGGLHRSPLPQIHQPLAPDFKLAEPDPRIDAILSTLDVVLTELAALRKLIEDSDSTE